MPLSDEMIEQISEVVNTDREFKSMNPLAKSTVRRRLASILSVQSDNAVEYLAHTLETPSETEPLTKNHRMLIFCISLLIEQEVSKYAEVDVSGLIRAMVTLGYMLRVDEERGIINVTPSNDKKQRNDTDMSVAETN